MIYKLFFRVLQLDPSDQTAHHMLYEEIKREIPQNPSHSGIGGDEDQMWFIYFTFTHIFAMCPHEGRGRS